MTIPMKQLLLALAIFIFLPGTICAQTKEEVIKKVWEAAGGKKNWEESRFLTFIFAPQINGKTLTRRVHLWDRKTGNYRFETKTSEKTLVVLFNLNSQKGQSFINGKALSDSLNTVEIGKAYKYFITDSYWLLAPLKFEDPGMIVSLEDSEEIDGSPSDVLYVTSEKNSQGPRGRYWFYVNPVNGRIRRCKILPEGKKDFEIYDWTNYKDLGGGLKLSTHKQSINKNKAIIFPVASVLVSVETEKFTEK
jgi:hypothetical protein